MRKIHITLLVLVGGLMSSIGVSAQNLDIGGSILNNDIIGWSDMHTLSFTSHNYGTARSMAMGNAFTALGGDMVSASLNPAGIAMYTRGDVTITPMVQVVKSPTSGEPYYFSDVPKRQREFKDNTTRFGLSNIGAIFKAYEGDGALTSVYLGIVYNQIADFNRSMLTASRDNEATNSMVNLFCLQSDFEDLKPNRNGELPLGNDPYLWGAELAYNTYLTNYDDEGWYVDSISDKSRIDQFSAINTRGSIGEYAFTAGFNLGDIVYLGATMGVQSLRYRHEVFYGENYTHPQGLDMEYQLDYMNYLQYTDLAGTGINFKFGATVRPVEWLRLGIAVHTPTYYTVSLHYNASMWNEALETATDSYDYKELATDIWVDDGPNAWKFRTPTRLLAGGAVTIAKRATLSFDYEHSWYQYTKLRRAPIYGLDFSTQMNEYFKGGDTFRVGAEVEVIPQLQLRVGYIWSGSAIRQGHENDIFTHMMPTTQYFCTAGLGLRFTNEWSLDVAYQYGRTNYTQHVNFYGAWSGFDSVEELPDDIVSKIFTTHTSRHHAVMTLRYRF